MSADIKLSKAQKKMVMSDGALGSILGKLIGPITKAATKILPTLGLTATMSAIDDGVKKNTWFWNNNFNIFK